MVIKRGGFSLEYLMQSVPPSLIAFAGLEPLPHDSIDFEYVCCLLNLLRCGAWGHFAANDADNCHCV